MTSVGLWVVLGENPAWRRMGISEPYFGVEDSSLIPTVILVSLQSLERREREERKKSLSHWGQSSGSKRSDDIIKSS
ncbi:hypothetical protein CEXT_394241 [Caerostris extrusa]|uniref:Uncharacterized protein n=1 Tax=Caerostris extrusa TaxID=172846 RepID=A0AAV4XPU3_CAEEX|nr:hypothetical protein CEXT_394241 [Caerostris extrusa]